MRTNTLHFGQSGKILCIQEGFRFWRSDGRWDRLLLAKRDAGRALGGELRLQ